MITTYGLIFSFLVILQQVHGVHPNEVDGTALNRFWPGLVQNKTEQDVSNVMNGLAAAHNLFGPAAFAMAEVRNISNRVLAGRLPDEVREEFRRARDALNAVGANSRVRQMLESLILDAKVRVEELRAKASCIRQRATEAREDAGQAIREVGKCAMSSGQEAAAAIAPVGKELEEHSKELADIAAKAMVGLLECRKSEQQSICRKEVILAAEKAAAPVTNAIKACLMAARECWKQLVDDLKLCFIGGAEQATVIEKELKLEILECVANG